jgi:predicted dehydrogenase
MTRRLRVGVIGCGAIAQIMHIPYIVDYDDKFELVALADIYRPALDAVADHYHIQRRYTDWRELLAQDDIEAVVICHSGSHRDSTIAAVEANKHVLVEKPLAWNVRETQEVFDVVSRSDRTVQMAYHKLYDPAFVHAKQHVQQMRDLGFLRITVLHPANELGFSPYRLRRGNGKIIEGHIDPGTWDEQVRMQLDGMAGGDLAPLVDEALGARKADVRLRLSYGIMCSSIIHQIYMLFGLLGEPLRVVSTEIWREGEGIHCIIEYPNELRCTLNWLFLSNLKDYCEEYAFFGNHDRVTLQFPSPYFKNYPSPLTIQGGEGELSWEKHIIISQDEAFQREILAFHDNIIHSKTPATTIADALKHSKFIQQMIEKA